MVLFYILPLAAVFISLATHANMLTSLLLFWGLPSLLLTIWLPSRALKAALFASVATVLQTGLNIIFYTTNQWYVVSMFDNRFLGFMAWEDIPYFFLFVYFPIMFWEYFYDKQTHEHTWTKRMTRLASVFIFVALAVTAAWAWVPRIIQIPYFYLLVTIVLVLIPLSLESILRPRLGLKFVRVGLYFAFVAILYELTAIYLGQWYFPSDTFIGWVHIIGLKFPIEEFLTWIVFGAAAILTWYEYFDDDNR